MKRKDWYLRVMVTLLVVGVWVLILKPVLAPAPSEAAAAEKVVRAQRFEVVDAEGKVRARLAVDSDCPGLWLYDEKSVEGAILVLLADGRPGLYLWDAQGKRRVSLEQEADGRPTLSLFDARGKRRAALGATDLGWTRTATPEKRAESSLVLFDKEGKVMWQAPP